MSAPLSFRLLQARARLSQSLRGRLLPASTLYVQGRVEEYRRYWEAGARALGAEFIPLLPDVWEVRLGDRRTSLLNYMTACDSPAIRHLAGDKPYCYRLARAAGLPVPPHVVVTAADLEPARRFIAVEQAPFVVKPARGTASALGVTTHVRGWKEFRRAAALASLYGTDILLERMVAGESCRLLFLDGRLIHAVRRRGLRVLGDGRRSLGELAGAAGVHLESDPNSRLTLGDPSADSARIPDPGEEVLVRSLPVGTAETRELRTVYDESVTHLCGPELVEECARVVRALGSEFAGIDLICNDLRVSLGVSGGTFLEINTTPGIHHHYLAPDDFAVNPVARQVLEYLLSRTDGAHDGIGQCTRG